MASLATRPRQRQRALSTHVTISGVAPALVAVLRDDGDENARVSAIAALEMMGARAQAAEADLRWALADKNVEVRKQAELALKYIEDAKKRK
jgi:hypothetical protein